MLGGAEIKKKKISHVVRRQNWAALPPELKHPNLHINNNRRVDNSYIKTRVSARMNVKFYPFGFVRNSANATSDSRELFGHFFSLLYNLEIDCSLSANRYWLISEDFS